MKKLFINQIPIHTGQSLKGVHNGPNLLTKIFKNNIKNYNIIEQKLCYESCNNNYNYDNYWSN